jgi:hypothetical protein
MIDYQAFVFTIDYGLITIDCLMFSLAISILEVQISVKAPDVELADLRSLKKK